MISIDASGDLVIKIVEFNDTIRRSRDTVRVTLHERDFLVKKDVIRKHSKMLRGLITHHLVSKPSDEPLIRTDDTVISMEVLFRLTHNNLAPMSDAVPIQEIWCLTNAAAKYEFDGRMLQNWFREWYIHHVASLANRTHLRAYTFSQLMYPCWQYDHAGGFLGASKAVVYRNEGHITEQNPTKHYNCCLPPRVLDQLNAVKGRLKTRLEALIHAPIKELLQATCDCKEKTMFQYEKALDNTGMWPLSPVWPRLAVNDILRALSLFNFEPPASACSRFCQNDYAGEVATAIEYVQTYFDGLCLDCMEKSNSNTGDYAAAYWHKDTYGNLEWARGCRVRHGEATWYFSWMGRRDEREQLFRVHGITRFGPP